MLSVSGLLTAGDYSGKGVIPVASHDGPCLSYDFIDLEYGINDYDSALLDNGDRWGVGFSKSFGSNYFLTGEYNRAGFDFFDGNNFLGADSNRYSLGLGTYWTLGDCLHLTFEGGGDYRDSSFSGNPAFDFDSWGYYVGPGLRARAGRLEGYLKLFYVGRESDALNFAGLDAEGWVLKPGVLFHLTDHLALKVSGDVAENESVVNFGVRYHF